MSGLKQAAFFMTKYQPSKEYLENINFYKEMHNSGFYRSDGKKSFYPLQYNDSIKKYL